MISIISINSRTLQENSYVLYYIEKLRKYCTSIYACVSTKIESAFCDKITGLVDDVFAYETDININKWRDVIVNRLGWEYVKSQESILFSDDSFFGPITTLDPFFIDLNGETDFWGMTEHGPMSYVVDGIEYNWPRFLQCYFFVVNHRMLSSEIFEEYVAGLPEYETFNQAAENFEYRFTEFFENKGFSWKARIETRDLENSDSHYFQSSILFNINELVQKRGYPFIPKLIFDLDNSLLQLQGLAYDVRRLMDYLDNSSDYETKLLYDNIIRYHNVHDLLVNLNLTYVVKETPIRLNSQKTGFFAYLFYEDLFEYSVGKLSSIPSSVDLYIATDTPEKVKIIKKHIDLIGLQNNIVVVLHTYRGRDISALLLTFKDYLSEYDVIGFVHDKKSSQMGYLTVGSQYNEWIWENMLFNKEYVNGVLNLFTEHPFLGYLAPPPVYHGTYFHTSINTWTICYEITKDTANRFGMNLQLDDKVDPDFLGSVFWCKRKALDKLFKQTLKEIDFPGEPLPVDGSFNHAIERMFPYIAQEAGFLSGFIMNHESAQINHNNFRFALLRILKELGDNRGVDETSLYSTLKSLENLESLCE